MRRSAALKAGCALLAAAVSAAVVAAAPGRQGGAGRQGGPRPLMGRVLTKADNAFEMQTMRRGGEGQQVKVTVEDQTRISRLEPGTAGDLTEGYLVAVVGDRDGGKVTAKGILRLSKIGEKPDVDEVRGAYSVGFFMGRLANPGQPQEQGRPGRGSLPVVGKLVSQQPLTVETIPMRPDQQAEKVEVVTDNATRILRSAKAAFGDIEKESPVLVMPKEAAEGQPIVARAVIQLPPMAGRPGAR